MTYKFKLSRRLAVARLLPIALLAAGSGCDTVDPMGAAETNRELVLSPTRATAEPHQTIRLAFRDQLGGDATPTFDVAWTVVGGGGQISPDGSFTATQPGVYTIIGNKGKGNGAGNNGQGKGNGGPNQTDTSTVVVVPPPPALTAVELSPVSVSIATNEHMTFEVVGRDESGATVSIGVDWSASGGTIDAGGHYIAGSAGGEYHVIALHAGSGLADTAHVSITPLEEPTADEPAPTPAPSSSPGLPDGFSLLSDRPFDAKVEHGWNDRGDSKFSILTDATAPRSSSTVGQAFFPQGFPSGSGPISTAYQLSGQRQIYLSFWIKMSDNWYGNESGVNKVFFFWMDERPLVYLSAQGAGMGSLEPQVRLQGTMDGGGNLRPNLASISLQRGKWHHWELVLEANTPGKLDGAARWWIDGVKVGEHSGLGFATSSESNAWNRVVWNPTYGGNANDVPSDQWMRMDHVVLGGR